MKPQSPLIILRDLAQDAVEQATQQLGQVRQAQLAAEQQLSMLLNYQDEYRQKLTNTLSEGMGSASWQNYQQFIGTLEQAISQHRLQLVQWSEKVERAVKQWQDKQQRLNAFETLNTRALSAEQLLENKRDQKLMDEFAQRSSQKESNPMNLNVLSGLLAAGDGSATGVAALSPDDAGLSSDFAQLLGERFAPDGQLSGKLTAAQLRANDPDAPTLSRQQLNQLLASLNQPGQLLAKSLAAEGLADGPTLQADGDDEKPLQLNSTLDAATLQALFAMLPATMLPAMAQPLQGNALATTAEPGGEDAPLAAASSLLSELSEKPPVGLPAQKTQAHINDKSVKTDTAAVLTTQPDGNQDQDAAPLKLAVEPLQSSTALHHSPPVPVSSPAIATQPASATVNAPATPQLNAQLGSPEWQQALGQQVLMFHRNGQHSAELRLHPQELGALQITLKIDDNQAQLHIASAHGQVRSAVEAALPHLRHALAESGINLGQSSVGGESLPQPQQSQQQASHHGGQPSYREQHGSAENGAETLSAPAALQAMARSVEGVDIFA